MVDNQDDAQPTAGRAPPLTVEERLARIETANIRTTQLLEDLALERNEERTSRRSGERGEDITISRQRRTSRPPPSKNTGNPKRQQEEDQEDEEWCEFDLPCVIQLLLDHVNNPTSRVSKGHKEEIELLAITAKYLIHFSEKDEAVFLKRVRLLYIAQDTNWNTARIDRQEIEQKDLGITLSDRAAAAKTWRRKTGYGNAAQSGPSTNRRNKKKGGKNTNYTKGAGGKPTAGAGK